MKQGWEIKKLGEICDFQNGFAFKSKTYKETGLPILRITNIQNQSLEINELVYFNPKDYKENFDRFKVFKDDLVVAMSGATTGKLGINTTDTVLYLNQRVGKFIPKKTLLKAYLYYFLSTKVEESLRIAAGAAQPNLSTEQINNFKIPLPPLPEQQRIVAILDETFASIAKAKANAEQNLKNAKELFESYAQGIFENKGDDWEEKRFDEVCKISSKLIDPKLKEFQNLIHIGAGNIESKKGTLVDLKTAKEENLISGKFLFDETMVLYSKIRPYLVKVVKCDFNGLCSADIYPLVPFKNIMIKEFLYYLLTSQNFTEYAIKGSQRAGMPKVNRNHLFAYTFNLPPLKQQQTIVQKLDALSLETKKLEGIYQKKIADLEELKKSVLQKAFAGELKEKSVLLQ
jgi:type I restriction enzyme S subunit